MRRVALVMLLGAGCTTFSSYQTARLLAPGRHALTAAGGYGFEHNDNGGFTAGVLAFDAMDRVGVTGNFEAGAKLSVLHSYGDLNGVGSVKGDLTLGFVDLKYALRSDQLALQLPVGVGYRGGGWHDLQIQPTLVHTATLTPSLELDSAYKLIVVSDDTQNLGHLRTINLAVDVGVRLHSDRWPVELHPEVGIMVEDATTAIDINGANVVVGAGLGVTLTL